MGDEEKPMDHEELPLNPGEEPPMDGTTHKY